MSTVTRRRRARAALPLALRRRLGRRGRQRRSGAAARPRLLRLRLSPAALAILLGLAVVLAAGWFWLRDSSLVAIRQVRIAGVSGPHAAQIRGALRATALTMTTLDVSVGRLEQSVAAYPDVVSISVDTSFPHGATIRVDEQVPLATVVVGGRTVAVGADGRLLRAPTRSDGPLPQLQISLPPGAGRIAGGGARAALRVLAAAPWAFVARIARAADPPGKGVVISLRNGPQLLFGSPDELRAKWAAVVAVLADSGTAGAAYIDVTDPAHPAAGTPVAAGAGSASSTTPAGTATSAAATGATTTAAGAGAAAPGGTATTPAAPSPATPTGATGQVTPTASGGG